MTNLKFKTKQFHRNRAVQTIEPPTNLNALSIVLAMTILWR